MTQVFQVRVVPARGGTAALALLVLWQEQSTDFDGGRFEGWNRRDRGIIPGTKFRPAPMLQLKSLQRSRFRIDDPIKRNTVSCVQLSLW